LRGLDADGEMRVTRRERETISEERLAKSV